MSKEDLIPVRTEQEAKEKGRRGGIKSGEVRRAKRLMSQIYADILNAKNNTSGLKLDEVIEQIIMKGGSPAVSMLKEIREATEGNKVHVDGDMDFSINIIGVKPE